jgi:hypothetical protein
LTRNESRQLRSGGCEEFVIEIHLRQALNALNGLRPLPVL